MIDDEPGLRFWLAYVESEGGLVEDRGEAAVVLLPAPLARGDGLGEELTVTCDPAVAAEDGATLMIAGHPALERAAAAVLARGDVARRYLPWPAGARPRADELQERARAQIAVDHGRVDVAGEPAACYRPLLRVGAMVSYSASLTHRFHEREEVWVDALDGGEVPDRLRVAIERGTGGDERPVVGARVLDADEAQALASAHRRLATRAAARAAALAAQTRRAMEAELARTDAFYSGALASIERRRAAPAASPERVELLAAQAQATREEQARRRREIAEQYRPEHEIHPFRLHLVCVPVYRLAVDIRRGAQRHPFSLCWLPLIGEFAPPRCPACGGTGGLVAGRERLGCEACLPQVPQPAPGRFAREAPAREPPREAPVREALQADPPAQEAPQPPPAVLPAAAEARRPPPAARKRLRAQEARERHERSRREEGAGERLAMGYWQTIAAGQRWPRTKLVAHSPLGALHRLYGNAGPLLMLGLDPGDIPTEVTAGAHPHLGGDLQVVSGVVTTAGRGRPYALWWSTVNGRAALAELTPFAYSLRPGPRARDADLPAPIIDLDPVAALLWQTELAASSMPVAVQALAVWWRLRDRCDDTLPPPVLAATIATAVATGAGTRRTPAAVAQLYGVDRPAVALATKSLAAPLRLVRERGW